MSKSLAFIVEDEEFLADIFATTLKEAGFMVEASYDGKTALEWLQNCSTVPALILLDLHIPQISGEELLNYIRSDERLKNVWVMLVTADALLAEQLQHQNDHMLVSLLKPISPDQLLNLSKRLGLAA
jgi:CheY-like chemotaxis protein